MKKNLLVRIKSKDTDEILLKCPILEKVTVDDRDAIKADCEQCGNKLVDSIVPETSRLASESDFWTVLWDDYNHVTLEVEQNDQYLDTVTVTWDEVRHKAEVVWTDDNGDEQVFDLASQCELSAMLDQESWDADFGYKLTPGKLLDKQVFNLDTNKMEKLEYLSAVITIRDSEAE